MIFSKMLRFINPSEIKQPQDLTQFLIDFMQYGVNYSMLTQASIPKLFRMVRLVELIVHSLNKVSFFSHNVFLIYFHFRDLL